MGGSAPRRDHQLPVETTSFVDRRGELAVGRELLARARLVTLTGPGGVGKTRLAARIAAGARRAFPDGVRMVHLSGLDDPALVPLAAADALDLHDHSARPPLRALVEQVRDRRLLLLIDNCEHLLPACAELAAALLHGTTGVRILATSRHRLGLTEEHLLDVRPLPVPDPDGDLSAPEGYPALALFADRAAAVVPGFRLTAANRASVARLCRRLDGLPLAIELAAVRMRVLDVTQLLDRLDDRYRLLSGGSPAALPRHQTLRAAVDWSHELCTEREQLVWARLSVLAGSFDLETAEAVCADGASWTAEAVCADGASWTAEAVCAGGASWPTEVRGESGLLADRVGWWVGEDGGLVAEPPAGSRGGAPGGAEGAAPLEDGTGRGGGGEKTRAATTPRLHPDDVLDAITGLIDKSVLSREDGPDGIRYRLLDTLRHYGLDRLRRQPGEEPAARRRQRDWMLRRAAACERAWFGPGQREIVARLRADQDNLRTALDFSLTAPDERLAGLRLAGTLWFYWHACGAPREGRYWLDRALAANPEPTRERARGLWIAGLLAAATHDLTEGLARARDAHALARDLGDEAEAAHAEYVIGVITLFLNDLPTALRHFEASVARAPVPGQHLSLHGLDQVELACALGFLGEAERAVEVCERARRMCERHGEEWVHSYVLRMLALAHTVQRDWRRAEHHARHALRLKLAVHDVTGIALTLDLLARIATETGDHERAAVLLGAADRTWAGIDRDRWGSKALNSTRHDSETSAREALPRPDYQRAYERGAGLGLAETVDYAVHDGRQPQRPTTARKPNGRPRPAHPTTGVRLTASATGVRLTRRENEVAELVAQGLANQQIADRLVIARRTAEGHVERILGKLGFSNRSQIAAWVAAQR
ncbi:LuxR family transcriptional regulator [Streptomyces sp. ISL-22]|uniref:ATP-binding protein n=1 Tax=unclassified Streptomyces TaxID=2593676 RepID=UPI001BE53374|nr:MULTISPECIES: LuxR C-terminal-related transcriptional regulator [unclassified Streptomyces]MBT2417932.1 LuxR family transcriptional regulator [Streptomyces sp. ISL-24]MBT2432393.1 LuxR family transcriptional regulator [Streptomyces sp. ISL-22]